jgi:hypothetical protein
MFINLIENQTAAENPTTNLCVFMTFLELTARGARPTDLSIAAAIAPVSASDHVSDDLIVIQDSHVVWPPAKIERRNYIIQAWRDYFEKDQAEYRKTMRQITVVQQPRTNHYNNHSRHHNHDNNKRRFPWSYNNHNKKPYTDRDHNERLRSAAEVVPDSKKEDGQV